MPLLEREARDDERLSFINTFKLPPDKPTSLESQAVFKWIKHSLSSSVTSSAFLSAEVGFAFLYLQLRDLTGESATPAFTRTVTFLAQLRKLACLPSRIFRLRDEPGFGLAFHLGNRRAELEILDDDGSFLTMYGREGSINVTEPDLDRELTRTASLIRDFLTG